MVMYQTVGDAFPNSQDECGIVCCLLLAHEAEEGRFGINIWGSK
jgi:hypothetical protein